MILSLVLLCWYILRSTYELRYRYQVPLGIVSSVLQVTKAHLIFHSSRRAVVTTGMIAAVSPSPLKDCPPLPVFRPEDKVGETHERIHILNPLTSVSGTDT